MAEASTLKKFSLREVEEHTDRKSPWLIIHDKVYDVTDWLEEHPGGEEVLLEVAGRDASECFEDIGHSTDARNRMKTYLIGEVRDEDKTGSKEQDAPKWVATSTDDDNSSSWETWFVPMTLAFAIWLIFQLF